MKSSVVLTLLASTFVLTACAGAYTRPHIAQPPPLRATASADGELQDVVLVGNNWDGTATVFDPRTFQPLLRLDIVPDWAERIGEIKSSPIRDTAFRLIRS